MEETLIRDFFSEEKTHWWHIGKRKLIKDNITPDQKDILIIGMGGGIICHELKGQCKSIIGLDLSEYACRMVKENFVTPTVMANLEEGLCFSDNRFDIIIASDVLEHLEDEKLLSETRRCLRENGILIVTVPAFQHMWSDWDERLGHKRRYNKSDLRHKLLRVGLSVNKITYFNAVCYPIAYIYRKFIKRNESSEFADSSGSLTSIILTGYQNLEILYLKKYNLCFGLSIFAKATNKEME